MSKRDGYTSAEMKAGIFLSFCIALFVAMLFVYGKASKLWQGHQVLSVAFNSVTSLRPDAPVRFNGVEVGRVKEIRIISLTPAYLERIPRLRQRDLENLPLEPAERVELGNFPKPPASSDSDTKQDFLKSFDELVRKKLAEKPRTMIELTLDVAGDAEAAEGAAPGRYRQDDQVRIGTTLLGDTAVEITSGTGEAVAANSELLLLGISGDFFSNLEKSVDQVKEILRSVSEVVGKEERTSVRNALRRFDSITQKVESIAEIAHKRLPVTWDKVDLLADNAKKDLELVGATVTELQPKVSTTLTSADEAIRDLQKRLGSLADEARQAVLDINTAVKPILADIHYMSDNSKDDFPLLVKNAKDLAVRLRGSADKLDGVLNAGNQLLSESYPDMRRLILALRMGAENFEEATNLIKRKPWLMLNKPEKESDFADAQQVVRNLELSMKRFRELNTELRALRRNAPAKANETQLQKLDWLIQELDILSATLDDSGKTLKKQVLPPFERKKGAFIRNPEMEELSGK